MNKIKSLTYAPITGSAYGIHFKVRKLIGGEIEYKIWSKVECIVELVVSPMCADIIEELDLE